MIRLLRSTSVRLALGYSLLFIVSSGVLVGVLWWRMTDYLDRATDAAIVSDTQAIGDRFGDFGLPGAIETIAERVARAADERAIYLLTDPRLTRIAGNLAAWPLEVERRAGWYQVRLVRNDRQHATRFLHLTLPGNYHLLVGRDVEDRVALRGLILGGLGWTAGASLLLAILGGLLVRRAVLRRIEEITRTTTGIVRGDLAQRLPMRGSDDEFDQLALTINGMLEQIQQLVENIQNTSNAIAHDLRTPLAELRGRLEDLLRARSSAEVAAQEIQGAVADVDRVIGIFNALLRLAEIDSGVRRSGFHKVDLAQLAADAAELYRPSLEERGAALTLDAPEGITVEGDPFLLAQAIGNLLDNAAKVAPVGSTVTLAIAARGTGEIAITVADRGPGIPDAEKTRVTERFFRGDASRGTSGSGLGLSLVDAVARLHGGRLELADNGPGLAASLLLPHSGG
jgi:signal transduction histidine kinase